MEGFTLAFSIYHDMTLFNYLLGIRGTILFIRSLYPVQENADWSTKIQLWDALKNAILIVLKKIPFKN